MTHDTDEHWKMAVAERLEDIYGLLSSSSGKQEGEEEDEGGELEAKGYCSFCYHEITEHTEKGCFHVVGSEDTEYCSCNDGFAYAEELKK